MAITGLKSASTQADAEQVIQEVTDEIADDDAISAELWRASMKAQMAGQLFVNDIELDGKLRSLAAGEPTDSFLNLPFADAIANFRNRRLVTPEQFDLLSDDERRRSFTMARAMSDVVRQRAFGQISAAMEPGGPGLSSFISSLEDSVIGDSVMSPRSYLETVFRTATATSYNAGRFRQQTSPAVVAAGLMWRYVTAGDSRVRDEHAALHGAVWPINDPEGLAVYPPNGFNCRCVMTVVEPEDVEQSELDREIPDGVIDAGFNGPPDVV